MVLDVFAFNSCVSLFSFFKPFIIITAIIIKQTTVAEIKTIKEQMGISLI